MADFPQFTNPKQYGYGIDNVEGGAGILNDIRSRMNMGLPEDVRNRYYSQILRSLNRNTSQGLSSINQNFANSGLTGGAKLNAVSDLFSNNGQTLTTATENLNNQDYQVRENNYRNGMNDQFQLLGLGAQIGQNKNSNALSLAQMLNNYNLQNYKDQQENGFSFGKLIGSLISAGGTIGGALLGMPQVGAIGGSIAGRAIGGG